jgi:hypothetical protein
MHHCVRDVTRCVNLVTRCVNLVTRCVNLVTRCVNLVTRCKNLVTRCVNLVTVDEVRKPCHSVIWYSLRMAQSFWAVHHACGCTYHAETLRMLHV